MMMSMVLITSDRCCRSDRGKEAIGHEPHDVDHCAEGILDDLKLLLLLFLRERVAVVKIFFNCPKPAWVLLSRFF